MTNKVHPALTIANIVCYIRLTIIFIALVLSNEKTLHSIVLLTFDILVLDALDGFLARKFDQKTKVGAHLDILLDSLCRLVFVLKTMHLKGNPLQDLLYFFVLIDVLVHLFTMSVQAYQDEFESPKHIMSAYPGIGRQGKFNVSFWFSVKVIYFLSIVLVYELGWTNWFAKMLHTVGSTGIFAIFCIFITKLYSKCNVLIKAEKEQLKTK